MNRNKIVKQLMSEGFTEKTLVNLSDKQLQILSDRIISEQTINKGTVKMDKNTNPMEIKKITDSGSNVELKETEEKKPSHKIGDKFKDSEGNTFTLRDFVKKGVTLKGAGGEKEVALSDLKHYKKIGLPKSEMKEGKPSVGASKKQPHKKVTPAAKWVDGVVQENYHVMTTKNEITSLVKQKLNEEQLEKDPKIESDTETTVYADGVSMDQTTAQKIANSNCKMKFMGKFPNKPFIKIIEKAHRTKDGFYRYEVGLKIKETESAEGEQKTSELKEQGIAPAKPKITPTTKPGEKPKTRNPYQPGPGQNPDPKANIPNWMKFDSIKK